MAIHINLDRAAVREVPIQLVTPMVRDTGRQVERGAKGMVRVQSGAVRAGISSTLRVTGTRVTMRVAASHPRSLLEHDGAKAHPIEARLHGPMLRFYWAKVGRVVFFRRVSHPGTRGSHFLTSPLVLFGVRAGFKVTISIRGLSGSI